VAGLPIAEANIIVDFADGSYNGLLDIETVGLASTIADWRYRSESAGRRDGDHLIPNEHITKATRGDRQRQVEIFYGPDGPDRVVGDPPIRQKDNRTPISDDMLPGTVDLVTALLAIFQAADHASPCLPPAPIFDGRHRFDLIMQPIAARRLNEGPFRGNAAGCQMRIEPLGGFRTGDENFNFNRVYDGWFADVLNVGVNMIVRVESEMAFGRAAIRLTDIRDFDGRSLRP